MKAGETVLNWLRENAGTIVVMLVLFAVIAAIIRYLIREKRSGNNSNTRR